jgi:hypothetical protein
MTAFNTGFRVGFFHGQGSEQLARERRAELHKPFAGNPPDLLAPVRCRVLKAFYAGGRAVQPGEEITLAKHDAGSMAALHRVEIIT